MKFEEGCVVALVESVKNVIDYVRTLIDIAKRVPVYVALHPTAIATRIRGVKRSIAIAPGSAVVCHEEALQELLRVSNCIELVEPTWIDVGLLVPVVDSDACSWLIDLGAEVDRMGVRTVGVARVIDDGVRDVMDGGIACVKECVEEIQGPVSKEPRMNPLFMFLKSFRVGGIVRARMGSIEVAQRIEPFVDTLVRIGGRNAILAIGRGYAALFEPIDEGARALVSVLGLVVLTKPLSDALARAHLSKLGIGL